MSEKADKAAAKADALMERASEALQHARYFEADRIAREAFDLAHRATDFDRIARITLPLQEARRQRRLDAADADHLVRVHDYTLHERLMADDAELKPGCYLIEPPLVGADGRNLRERFNHAEVPAIVIVREPVTQLGKWPIVMIGPVTVRAYVDPPDDDEPNTAWMLAASEALGDAAIASADPEAEPHARVDQLIDRLHTVVDHEKLIQELEHAARAAASVPA